MLNAGDIEFMKRSQDEIYTLRERPISLVSIEKVYDDFTGQLIDESETEHATSAVVTEITIRSKDGARYLEDGIEYEQGDVKIDIKSDNLIGITGDILRAYFDGKEYE